MCAVAAFDYRDMLCGMEHSCYTAPVGTAFLAAIPFGFGMISGFITDSEQGRACEWQIQITSITINLDRKAGQPVRLSLHLVPKLQ